ncbi:family 20 glycosylhydrolase [Alkalimonas delamerensis]|uniref:beta-N-acetylhexosaminidase n=1 Tax=Alkalimonas delamerensis TaxID=265981 RepID=A0ABT9GKN2_9GAMM|nr:family 20 glycosylhydrolase [Alkalimonas delamerensis]MDP4527526.1 family 20 glycosylhydrolase [Alkalimonas delamerensis]
MIKKLLTLSLAGLSWLALAGPFQSQQQLADFTGQSQWFFAVESNLLPEPGRFSARIEVYNGSNHALPAGERDWAWYFHSIRKIDTTQSQGLQLEHVQGDLHRIRPTSEFAGLAAGDSIALRFTSAPWIISYSDWMPRAFMVSGSLAPSIFANTDSETFHDFVRPMTEPEQLLRNFGDGDQFQTMTPERRFANNSNNPSSTPLNASQLQQRIIPQPVQLQHRRGHTSFGPHWQLQARGALAQEADYLTEQLSQYFGQPLSSAPNSPQIELQLDSSLPNLKPEGYQLSIERQRIRITGYDEAGVFYGIQSLLALLPVQSAAEVTLPQLSMLDYPRFSWRGMHYDMARNFHGLEVTLRLIEQMGRYKLNKLHLHLTEDEGWRLEIPGLPELTEIGANRCFDLTEQQCLLTQLGTGPFSDGTGNGYYSREDFIQILRHAKKHHIEVIPEIDMPGHARAAIKAMEARYQRLQATGQPEEARRFLLSEADDRSEYLTVQNYNDNSINVCLDSSYAFIDKVMYELQQMYREAGLRLRVFHMGGDEVGAGSWQGAPACQQLMAEPLNGVAGVGDLKPYFINRVAQLANQRGLAMAAWEDGLMADSTRPFRREQFDNSEVIVNAWDNIWEWGYGDRAYRFANEGYQVVQSAGTNLYFDHPQDVHPEERGYYWAARYTDTEKVFFYRPDHLYSNAEYTRDGTPITDLEALLGRALPELEKPDNMLGIQGQVWTETIRTAEQLEPMIYPRLIALAERAWHRAEWEPNKQSAPARLSWQQFLQRLTSVEFPRLAQTGAGHYMPPPGAIREQGNIRANHAWPAIRIEYSLDQGQSWQQYQQPLQHDGDVWLRGRSLSDQRSRIIRL